MGKYMSTAFLPEFSMLIAYRLFKRGPGGEESLGYYLAEEIAEKEKEAYISKEGERYRDYIFVEQIEIKS